MAKDFYMLYQIDQRKDRYPVKCTDVREGNAQPIQLPPQIATGCELHVPAVSIPWLFLYAGYEFPSHLPGGLTKYVPLFPATPAMKEPYRLEHPAYLYDELHEYEIPGQIADRTPFPKY